MSDYNDLHIIKKRLLEEDLIEKLLEELECENIRFSGGRYEARLPDKYKSRNPRSVQIYTNEKLTSKIRNKGFSGDIFGLVTFFLYDIDDSELAQDYLHQSKSYICNLFGWDEYLKYELGDDFSEPKKDYLSFLRPIKKERKKRKRRLASNAHKENVVLDKDRVFNWYEKYPHKVFLDDGINIKTQNEFEIMFDTETERIVFPIYNQSGELISIKGRYVGKDSYIADKYKYLYLYNFDKMIELYNLHKALPFILKTGEVIVFESEKSCMKAWQYGWKNTVSIMGNELSPYQSFLLRQLGVNIVFAFDKDIEEKFIKSQAKQIKTRKCFWIHDTLGLLNEKDAPVDQGKNIWIKLYKECLKMI